LESKTFFSSAFLIAKLKIEKVYPYAFIRKDINGGKFTLSLYRFLLKLENFVERNHF